MRSCKPWSFVHTDQKTEIDNDYFGNLEYGDSFRITANYYKRRRTFVAKTVVQDESGGRRTVYRKFIEFPEGKEPDKPLAIEAILKHVCLVDIRNAVGGDKMAEGKTHPLSSKSYMDINIWPITKEEDPQVPLFPEGV